MVSQLQGAAGCASGGQVLVQPQPRQPASRGGEQGPPIHNAAIAEPNLPDAAPSWRSSTASAACASTRVAPLAIASCGTGKLQGNDSIEGRECSERRGGLLLSSLGWVQLAGGACCLLSASMRVHRDQGLLLPVVGCADV